MRAMLVTTLLSVTLLGSGVASSVFAEEPSAPTKCSRLMVFGGQKGYPLQDLGIDGSAGKYVTQNMLAVTCGHFTADWWSSTQLSGGTYGRRGKGDEHDFELTYVNSVNTPIGKVNYAAYAAYFALDLGKGLGSTADDYAQVYGEVSRPIAVSKSWTLSPFVRYIHNFPMTGAYHPLDWVRVGGRLNGSLFLPVVGKVATSMEVAHTTNFNSDGVVPFKEVWRGELDFAKPLGYGWTGTLGAKFTDHVGATPLVKFTRAF